MEIAGDDLAILDALALHAVDFSKRSGIMVDVDSNVRIRKPEIRISPRRPQLEDIGIPAKLLGMILRGNIEGLKVGTFKRQDRSFDIRVKLRDREGFDQIHEYTFMSKQGRPLSIGTVCDVRFDGIPVQITRSDKRRIVKFFANCAPDVALGDAVKALGAEMRSRLPQGYEANFTGKVEVMGDAQRDFLEAIVLASLLTYLLIAAILESWIQPFIILLTLPLALVGMFTALYLAGLSLSMMGLLGAVMLIGIVVNNAILIMDQVVIHRARAVSPSESMLRAAKEKFRPILMTSLAAILGMLPMAFGKGLGSEIRESCGMAVIGGLISSTLLSVYLIPVVYVLFMQDRKKTACADNLKT
jgi:HAE1 family hydrophobic/amphiphilic exporter-1